MNETLIENWNRTVSSEDTVYILGDFVYGDITGVENILQRLNGAKHLISGNHERSYFSATLGQTLNDYWTYEGNYKEKTVDERKVIMCHYPMMSWIGDKRGSFMVHGHIHNKDDQTYTNLWYRLPNLLNAGVDVNGYRPVTLDDLIENNTRRKKYLEACEHGEKCGNCGYPLSEAITCLECGQIKRVEYYLDKVKK